MNTETIEVAPTEQAVVLAEIIPSAELIKINATDAGLAQLRDLAITLSSKPIENNEQYVEVHQAVMVAVKVRTNSEKLAKKIAAPIKETYDKILAEGKRIGDHAKESENLLRPLKEAYETEQERIKEEKAKAEAAKIADRANSLVKIGAVFNGMTYEVYGVFIDAIELNLPDNEWLDLYDSAQKAFVAEEERITKSLIEEENARIESERIAKLEREKQEQERIRLENESKQLAQQKADFEAEQQKQRDEMATMILGIRKERLTALGMVEEDGSMVYEGLIWFTEYGLKTSDNAAFERIIGEFNQWLADEKQKAEQAERERIRYESRVPRLTELGFVKDSKGFSVFPHLIDERQIKESSDEEFDAFIADVVALQKKAANDEAVRIKAEKQAETDRKKADKERQERLKDDKKLLKKHFTAVGKTPALVLTQSETIDVQLEFEKRMKMLVSEFTEIVESL